MIFLDDQHSTDLQIEKVAWPDWWTDGTASAMNETKVIRNVQAELNNISGLLSFAVMNGAHLPHSIYHDIEKVYDNVLFYNEHTHGAAESVFRSINRKLSEPMEYEVCICMGSIKRFYHA